MTSEAEQPFRPHNEARCSEDPDAALALNLAAGSTAALAELVRRHQNALLNFFLRMGAYSNGEDLVQETFLRVFRYGRRYRPSARFRTFLYTLARHVWADYCRKQQRRERLGFWLLADAAIRDEHPPTPSPRDRMDVRAALNALSPKLREVLVLSVYQGLRYREIAEVLGVPLGTVKSRMNLALENVRKMLNAP